MTFYELKSKVDAAGSTFFNPSWLKFFGERLSSMKILKKHYFIMDHAGQAHECFCVSATRTKDWRGTCKPYKHYHYFDVATFEHIT